MCPPGTFLCLEKLWGAVRILASLVISPPRSNSSPVVVCCYLVKTSQSVLG